MDYPLLFQNFNRYTSITELDYSLIETALIKRYVKKKRTILNQGDISRYLIFVLKGSLRSFTVDSDGNEHVMQFAFEGHWVSDLSSFITQAPGEMVIEAIEDCEAVLLPHKELNSMLDRIPALEKYFRQLYQQAYVGLQKRVNLRASASARERYEELIAQHPNIAKRIPLQHIASYLGITAESLSRVRSKKANER
jgi:CRP-like cAMP-binding protein